MLFLNIAYAASPTLDTFIDNVVSEIINPLIGLLFAVAFVVFIWGVAKYIFYAGNENERKQGQQNMIWGLVGMVIMVSVMGIIQVALGTFNIPVPK